MNNINMDKIKIDYGEIVRKAFALCWEYKSLWILGLFTGTGWGMTFYDFPDFSKNSSFPMLEGIDVEQFLQANSWVLIVAGMFILVYVITFILLSCICQPALIDAVNRVIHGGTYKLRVSFAVGMKYIWRFLGLGILEIAAMVMLLIITIVYFAIAFAIHVVVGILSVLVAIPIGFVCLMMLVNILALAGRAIVVRDISITDAITEGYHLFMMYKVPNLVFFLLFIGLSIAISVSMIIVYGIISIPLFFLGTVSNIGLLAAIAIGVPLFFIISIPLSGFLGAAFEAMFTIFYFRLLESPQPQPSNTFSA